MQIDVGFRHVLAIVAGENGTSLNPAMTYGLFTIFLPCLLHPEDFHQLRRQSDHTGTALGLGRGKLVSSYLKNILLCVGILVILTLSVLVYSGSNYGYSSIFILAILLSPMLIILIPKNSLKIDFAFAIFMVLVISLLAFGYWEYRDRPISNPALMNPTPEELMGGWFSFENRLRLDLMFIWGIISVAVSLIIRTIFTKIRAIKS